MPKLWERISYLAPILYPFCLGIGVGLVYNYGNTAITVGYAATCVFVYLSDIALKLGTLCERTRGH